MQRSNPLVSIPPPLFYVLAFLLGLAPEKWLPTPTRPEAPWDGALFFLGVALIAMGFVLGPLNAIRFLLKKTTLIPTKQASVLFTSGVYRFSRNPMYIGLFLIYGGVAVVNW